MSNYLGMEKKQPEKLSYLPNVNSLLKISLGLIFFTMISTALVYAESLTVDVDGTSYDVIDLGIKNGKGVTRPSHSTDQSRFKDPGFYSLLDSQIPYNVILELDSITN